MFLEIYPVLIDILPADLYESLISGMFPICSKPMSYQLLNICNIIPGLDLSMKFCVAVAHLFSVLHSFLSYEYAIILCSLYCHGHLGYSCLVLSCTMLLLTFLPDPGTNVQVYFQSVYLALCLRIYIYIYKINFNG